jgi:hypothetical protein
MDKNKFWLGGRLFNTASPRLGAPMQRKARPQVGHPNATQGTSASSAPQCTSATQMQGTNATWLYQRNARHVRKLGAQTQRKVSSQDGHPNEKLIHNENRLGGRLLNTASPRLGAPTQREARPQDGRSNATQGTSARWAPKRKTDLQRKRPHKGALG